MKLLSVIIIFLFSVWLLIALNSSEHKYIPKEGYVSNDTIAFKVAEAILTPIYGDLLNYQKPFKAKLIGDTVWVIKGTLPKDAFGGVAYIEIRKSDCKIIKVTHGK